MFLIRRTKRWATSDRRRRTAANSDILVTRKLHLSGNRVARAPSPYRTPHVAHAGSGRRPRSPCGDKSDRGLPSRDFVPAISLKASFFGNSGGGGWMAPTTRPRKGVFQWQIVHWQLVNMTLGIFYSCYLLLSSTSAIRPSSVVSERWSGAPLFMCCRHHRSIHLAPAVDPALTHGFSKQLSVDCLVPLSDSLLPTGCWEMITRGAAFPGRLPLFGVSIELKHEERIAALVNQGIETSRTM
jgi:hypothetical protein